MSLLLGQALLASACAKPLGVNTVDLRCASPFKDGSFIGLCSLRSGQLPLPPERDSDVDLVYYFDDDDCSHGALMGADDRAGFLFPLGHRDWDELEGAEFPTSEPASVAAIEPLDREQEGLVFWLKCGEGEPVLVRIAEVQEASHADLVAGEVPTLRLEWRSPQER